ncbi:hypothetical protein [Trichlorobacter lovleyi]|uniref:Hemerythrin-like domain-containing protein n=2 Tax=Trichlorobacter lovleyi TaxID=313985 RepID=B3E7M8_TRIL1|nr:hypothetical protein [Trichlorobacter lovleyi]ACD95010.1 hypothetical protein Glov_1288 [Trichlorobacter lovleyi SZ]
MSSYSPLNTFGYVATQHLMPYDSRQARLISVLDAIIATADQVPPAELEHQIEDLLGNVLGQTASENVHMFTIDYLAYEDHKLDHFRICTTIAGIRCKAARALCIDDDLQTLRKLLSLHIDKHDQMLEQYLISGVQPYQCRQYQELYR